MLPFGIFTAKLSNEKCFLLTNSCDLNLTMNFTKFGNEQRSMEAEERLKISLRYTVGVILYHQVYEAWPSFSLVERNTFFFQIPNS